MFDLEQEIMSWRRGLEQAPLTVEAIDELESHLRDELDRQRRAGKPEMHAFAEAVRRLGEKAALQREYAIGDDGIGARVRRTFRRVNVGFAHSRHLNVLAIAAAAFGVLVMVCTLYAAKVTYARLMVNAPPSEFLFAVRLSIGLYLGVAVVCGLGVVTCCRYWRSHEIAAARGLIAFTLFIGWFVVWGVVMYVHSVVLRLGPLFGYGSSGKLIYVSSMAVILPTLWWIGVCRLSRMASSLPRRVG